MNERIKINYQPPTFESLANQSNNQSDEVKLPPRNDIEIPIDALLAVKEIVKKIEDTTKQSQQEKNDQAIKP